jgi:CRP-like cAMP-binding protein
MEKHLSLLTNCPLFNKFTPEQIAKALRELNADIKKYKKGQLIFMAWEPATTVGIMLEGNALVIKLDYDGNRNILTKLHPSELFGEVFACLKMSTLPVSVEATTDATVLFINSRKLFLPQENPTPLQQQVISNMLLILAKKNMLLSKKITVISQHSTQEKLLTFLYDQATIHGSKTFTLAWDRQALADYLCVERSAMSAELSKLQKQGKIKYRKNSFTLQ